MQIEVTIRADRALRLGLAMHGRQMVDVDASRLTPDERAMLSRATRAPSTRDPAGADLVWDYPEPDGYTVGDLLAEAQTTEAQRGREDAAKAAAMEEWIAALVAREPSAEHHGHIGDSERRDPRVIEWLARRAALIEVRRDEAGAALAWLAADPHTTSDTLEAASRAAAIYGESWLAMLDRYAPGAYSARCQSEREAAAEAKAAEAEAKRREVATAIAGYGLPGYLARYEAGRLSEEEIDASIERALLAPFLDLHSYIGLVASDCPHEEECPYTEDEEHIAFHAEDEDPAQPFPLTEVAFAHLATITSLRDAYVQNHPEVAVSLTVRRHWVICEAKGEVCDAGSMVRYGVRVRGVQGRLTASIELTLG